MPTGTIKKLMEKGFGFITPDEAAPGAEGDMFFHMNAVQGTDFNSLQEGQKVSYTAGINPRNNRPQAESVSILGE